MVGDFGIARMADTNIYFLFTRGRLPHEIPQETPLRVLRRLYATRPAPPVQLLVPDLVPELGDLVMGCLAARPASRPSIKSIVLSLESLRDGPTAAPTTARVSLAAKG